MAFVTVTEAANLAGVSRGTIYNKIQDGELSKARKGIDTAELLRVFGEISLDGNRQKRQKNTSNDGNADSSVNSDVIQQALLARLDKADERNAWLQGMYEQKENELRRRNDELQALLPAPGELSAAEKLNRELGTRESEIKQLKEKLESYGNLSLWQRLFGLRSADY